MRSKDGGRSGLAVDHIDLQNDFNVVVGEVIANASDLWTISPRTVNQFWASHTRQNGGRIPVSADPTGSGGSNRIIQLGGRLLF